MKLAIQLSEAPEQRLAEIAARLGVPADSLAEAGVRELVERSSGELDEVADHLLAKNRELYERLR